MPAVWHLSCIIKSTSTVFVQENRHAGFLCENLAVLLFKVNNCGVVLSDVMWYLIPGSDREPTITISFCTALIWWPVQSPSCSCSIHMRVSACYWHRLRHFQESSPPQPPPALSSNSVVLYAGGSFYSQVNFLSSLHAAMLYCCRMKLPLEKTHTAKSNLIAICYVVSVSDWGNWVKLLIRVSRKIQSLYFSGFRPLQT